MQNNNINKKAATISQSTLVKSLLKFEYNRKCADCASSSVTWAVLNMGTLVCADCASIHRSFGTHISIVKSISLDNWRPEYLEFMSKNASNATHNAKYEATITNFSKPKQDSSRQAKERFMKDKYINKLWFNASSVMNSAPEEQDQKPAVEEFQKNVVLQHANVISSSGKREIKRKYPSGHPSKGFEKLTVVPAENLLIMDNEKSSSVNEIKEIEKPNQSKATRSEIDEILLPLPSSTLSQQESSTIKPSFAIPAKMFDMNEAFHVKHEQVNEQEAAKKKIMSLFDSPAVPRIVKPHYAPVPFFSHQ